MIISSTKFSYCCLMRQVSKENKLVTRSNIKAIIVDISWLSWLYLKKNTRKYVYLYVTVYVHICKHFHHLCICIFVVHKRYVAKIYVNGVYITIYSKRTDFETFNCPPCKVTNNFQQICHFHAGYRMEL